MIEAIIFDCFGVLCSDGWLPFRERNFGMNPSYRNEAILLNRAVDAGALGYTDFLKAVADLANLDFEMAKQQIEDNIPDEQVFELIKQLKKTYKIGMLSNAGENWLNDIFLPEQVALFDEVVLSCDIGIIKPEAGAYTAIASKLDVDPSRCIFIDDQPKYVDGAVKSGMLALLFTNVSTLRRDLETLITQYER